MRTYRRILPRDPVQKRELLFWKKVEKGEGCWLWKGAVANGYGVFWDGSRLTPAHRFSLSLAHHVLDGLHVHHECGNKLCVNPSHLVGVTTKDHKALHSGSESCYATAMPKVSMFIELDSEVNERISELARLHRRSKRMEVTHALDLYVKDYRSERELANTDGEEQTT